MVIAVEDVFRSQVPPGPLIPQTSDAFQARCADGGDLNVHHQLDAVATVSCETEEDRNLVGIDHGDDGFEDGRAHHDAKQMPSPKERNTSSMPGKRAAGK